MKAVPAPLLRRAARAGLQVRWSDVAGVQRDVRADVIEAVLCALHPDALADGGSAALLTCRCGGAVAIPGSASGPAAWISENNEVRAALRRADGSWQAPLGAGYWTWQQGALEQRVAVAPAHAWFPEVVDGERPWGVAAQVYGLRGMGDAGIGDSSGISDWIAASRRHGAHAVALSPIHAAMPIRTGYSPYSPSDRRWLEPLHAAPMQVLPEAADAVRRVDPVLDAGLRQHEAAERLDWPAAAASKWQWIGRMPAWLQVHQPQQWRTIETAMAAGGDGLAAWASQTAALSGHPAALLAFAQWLAQSSWQQVQRNALDSGMRVGLIADLAIGFDPSGVEAQDNAAATLRGLELGAPPDAFNPHGQTWGITGYSPIALRALGYAPFIALLRAVMAQRGGVRIDHILGLRRLWVLPRGAGAGEGIYLDYPFDDLLNLLVLESWCNRCLVIGEDLGVVAPGIRDALAARGVLGLDVLTFSRDETGFWPASQWRRAAVAMTSTHDLPPLAGWLQGRDLQWRTALGWNDASATRREVQRRDQQIRQLSERVAAEQLASGDLQRDAIALTARSPARLALLPLEDAVGSSEQPNLPGTVDEHPNWRQRLPRQLDTAATDARLAAFAAQRAQRRLA